MLTPYGHFQEAMFFRYNLPDDSATDNNNSKTETKEKLNEVSNPTEKRNIVEFANKIVETGEKLQGKLKWFESYAAIGGGGAYLDGEYIPGSKFCGGDPCALETKSDYQKMFSDTLSGEIQTLVCWQLYGYLLLKLGILTDPHSHELLDKQIINWVKLARTKEENTKLNAGDLVFMDGSDHVVISTGKDNQVLSLWTHPKCGVCLTTIEELVRHWPSPYKEDANLKPKLSYLSVEEVYTFVQDLNNPKKEVTSKAGLGFLSHIWG